MLKALFCFFVVLIFVSFAAASSAGSQPSSALTPPPTVEQLNSCAKCLILDTNQQSRRWCVEDGAGCTLAADCSGFGSSPTTFTATPCPVGGTRLADCDGCIKGSNTWCVVKLSGATKLEENKCIPKVETSDLPNGSINCRHGQIYNQCRKSSLDDRTPVPAADTDLIPAPAYLTCDACVGVSGMTWCIIDSPPDTSFSCRASNDGTSACTTKVDSGGSCGSIPEEKKVFKYSYSPQTCKSCVLDASDSWCSGSEIVGFKGCIATNDAVKKCPGSTHTRDCRSHLDEVAHQANPRSKTCDFCKAFKENWCERTYGSGANAVTARACFAGGCPLESTTVVSCDSARSDSYTYLPPVPQDLPEQCRQCKTSQKIGAEELNAWCYADEVRTCLPSWSFGFYCPKNGKSSLDAECPVGEDGSRKFAENPLVLPQTCQQCVYTGSWCLTEFSSNKFQFCVTDATKALCTKGRLMKFCSGLKDEEKKALIPTPVPRKCKECVGKNGWKWCVHSGYGDKIRICIPTEAVETLCSNETGGVAFHHCQIAAEDQEISSGLYQLPDGSAAFASLSLMAITVAVGLSL